MMFAKTLRSLLAFIGLCPFLLYAQFHSAQEKSRAVAQAARVTIIRDRWGIPHIYGATDADAVFGLMYAECEEDFSQVERNYLEVLGRLAEADGPASLNSDLQMRLVEDSADAIRDYGQSPVWFRRLLDAFADGINYYLFLHPEIHPAVLQRFEPWFPLMFTDGSVSATRTGGIRPDELRSFYEKHAEIVAAAPATIREPEEQGSNGMALAPSRSQTGHALLYINPHVPFYFRTEVQMSSGEGLDAYGAVTWGQFFVYQGFNAHCGWMHTTSYADVADLYEERIRQDDSGFSYFFAGQWKPVLTRPLQIRYRKGDSAAIFQCTAYFTGHGPVVGARRGKWLSLKEHNRSLNALIQSWAITKAKDFASFTQAMRLLSNTTNNTVYADDCGHIAYWHGNFIPRRNPIYDFSLPVDGTVAETDWQGVHGLEETVHIYDPPGGWIENCNSTPFTAAGRDSPHREDYPSYMAPDGQNARALRAMQLLGGNRKFSLDDLIKAGYDHYLLAFDSLIPSLVSAYDALPASDSLRVLLDTPLDSLRNWNRFSAANSVATTLACLWAGRLAQRLPDPQTAEAASQGMERIRLMVRMTPGSKQLALLADVLQELIKKFGTWQLPWGDLNRYQRSTGQLRETFSDSLPSLPVSMNSSRWGCIPAFESSSAHNRLRYGNAGNSFVAAVEFGPRLRAKTIATGGQSHDPASTHFRDQAQGFLEGQFKEVYFYKADVLAHAERTYHPGQ
jgi:acyl-homoserine-lactone acylase